MNNKRHVIPVNPYLEKMNNPAVYWLQYTDQQLQHVVYLIDTSPNDKT
ncbi:MAG TPA: hypothetical protein PLB87_10575 [Prolixibacteraceae bacterium]|nr:hypothetical protein [Prolixibacteraceae bacterium]